MITIQNWDQTNWLWLAIIVWGVFFRGLTHSLRKVGVQFSFLNCFISAIGCMGALATLYFGCNASACRESVWPNLYIFSLLGASCLTVIFIFARINGGQISFFDSSIRPWAKQRLLFNFSLLILIILGVAPILEEMVPIFRAWMRN